MGALVVSSAFSLLAVGNILAETATWPIDLQRHPNRWQPHATPLLQVLLPGHRSSPGHQEHFRSKLLFLFDSGNPGHFRFNRDYDRLHE
jgi:hypothetical protein